MDAADKEMIWEEEDKVIYDKESSCITIVEGSVMDEGIALWLALHSVTLPIWKRPLNKYGCQQSTRSESRGSEEGIIRSCYSESTLEEETVHRRTRYHKGIYANLYFCNNNHNKLDNFTCTFISKPLLNQEPHNESKVKLM